VNAFTRKHADETPPTRPRRAPSIH
jgi:hypothetical protein